MENIYIGTTGLRSPCVKSCPNRQPGCRDTCQLFIEYEEKRMAISKVYSKSPSSDATEYKFYVRDRKMRYLQNHGKK